MRSKRITALIMCLLTSLLLCIGMYQTTYADAGAVQTAVQSAIDRNGGQMPASLSGYFRTGAIQSAEEATIMVTVGGLATTYVYNTSQESQILAACNSAASSAELNTALNSYSLQADIEGASEVMSGFKKPLGVFLGILVTLVTLGMTLFTGLDICYIAFPVFRGKMDTAKSNGTRGLTKTGKDGETKLTFITEDAQYAVVAADMANTGANPFWIYAKKRIVSFCILAILLFIFVTGKINIVANMGVKLVSGILNMINSSGL